MQGVTCLPAPFGHAVLVCEGLLARGIPGDILGQFSNVVQCQGTLNTPAQLPDTVWPGSCSSCPNLWSQAASEPHSGCGTALCRADAPSAQGSMGEHQTQPPSPTGPARGHGPCSAMDQADPFASCGAMQACRRGRARCQHAAPQRQVTQRRRMLDVTPSGAPQGHTGLCSAALKHHVCPKAEGAVPWASPRLLAGGKTISGHPKSTAPPHGMGLTQP